MHYDASSAWGNNPKAHFQGFKSARLAPIPLGQILSGEAISFEKVSGKESVSNGQALFELKLLNNY